MLDDIADEEDKTPECIRRRAAQLMRLELEEAFLGRRILLGNATRRTVGCRTEHNACMFTEQDRIEILRRDFGVCIHPTDVEHIKGRKAAMSDSR